MPKTSSYALINKKRPTKKMQTFLNKACVGGAILVWLIAPLLAVLFKPISDPLLISGIAVLISYIFVMLIVDSYLDATCALSNTQDGCAQLINLSKAHIEIANYVKGVTDQGFELLKFDLQNAKIIEKAKLTDKLHELLPASKPDKKRERALATKIKYMSIAYVVGLVWLMSIAPGSGPVGTVTWERSLLVLAIVILLSLMPVVLNKLENNSSIGETKDMKKLLELISDPSYAPYINELKEKARITKLDFKKIKSKIEEEARLKLCQKLHFDI